MRRLTPLPIASICRVNTLPCTPSTTITTTNSPFSLSHPHTSHSLLLLQQACQSSIPFGSRFAGPVAKVRPPHSWASTTSSGTPGSRRYNLFAPHGHSSPVNALSACRSSFLDHNRRPECEQARLANQFQLLSTTMA